MFLAIAAILFTVIVSDAFVELTALPVPGPALGMLALFAAFCRQGGPHPAIGDLFDAAAPHVALFFVPAAVGVVASLDELGRSWLSILVAIVAGTTLTIAATGLVAQALMRRSDRSAQAAQTP